MKVTMEMTLDGLVKALRLRAHGLAEDAEAGYVRREDEPGALVVRRARHPATLAGQPVRNKGFGE